VQEGLPAEHGGELLADAAEHLLDGGGVADEGGGHLEARGRDVTHGGLDVVGDPLHEVGGVLVLHVEHLLVHLLGAHLAAEHGGRREVATVARVGGAHHVLGVPHLLGELRDRQGAVLLGAPGGERREADHEEVQARERDEVDGQLAEVGVELAREAEAAGDAAHGGGDEVVEVAEARGGELERAEADVVERLVVEHHALVRVLHELVHGQRGVVGLHHGVGDLGRGEDGEGEHHPVGVLLADLGDEERAHAGPGAAAEGVAHLEACRPWHQKWSESRPDPRASQISSVEREEKRKSKDGEPTLQAVAVLGLLSHDVEHGVDELGSLGVVALGPVVACSGLAEDEVVGAEDVAVGPRADGVHGAGLQVHEDGAGHEAAAGGLVVVDVDALELEVGVAAIAAGGVDAVLGAHHLPELGPDLVAALAALDVEDLPHGGRLGDLEIWGRWRRRWGRDLGLGVKKKKGSVRVWGGLCLCFILLLVTARAQREENAVHCIALHPIGAARTAAGEGIRILKICGFVGEGAGQGRARPTATARLGPPVTSPGAVCVPAPPWSPPTVG